MKNRDATHNEWGQVSAYLIGWQSVNGWGCSPKLFSFWWSNTLSSFLFPETEKYNMDQQACKTTLYSTWKKYWHSYIGRFLAASVDINKKQNKSFTAPTPQNTPINPAPITSEYRPSISSISEENNQGMLSVMVKVNILSGGLWETKCVCVCVCAMGVKGILDQDMCIKETIGLMNMLSGALATMLQGRLGSLASNPLPASVQRRIHGLQYLQSQHAELEGKFQEEILALEKKYLALYTPLYTKRAQVISGAYEPTEEEVEAGKKVDQEQDEDSDQQKNKQPAASTSDNKQEEEEDEQHVDGIPEFWLTALKNHPQISESITDQDEQALKHLVDIRLSYMDKPGFKLEFEFADNDYFTDKVLTKTYYYQDHAYGGDFVYDHAEGCQIHWKENKDLTVKVETKKQRHKGK